MLATRGRGDAVLGESVFATLMDQGCDTLLEQAFRLSAELAAWPSAQLYDGRRRTPRGGSSTHAAAASLP